MKTFVLAVASIVLCHPVLGQTTPSSLLVTNINNITSTWAGECGAGTVDNRSFFTRQNLYHSVYAIGSGTWSVTIQYSNTACNAPWTSYGGQATINQASNPPVAFAMDPVGSPAKFVNITVTGNAVVTYSAERQLFLSTASGTPVFPCSIAQGCTGQTTASAGLQALLSGSTQGTITNKVQMAGANSNIAGAPLCDDASGNTTTSGCVPALPSGNQGQYLQIQPNTGSSSTLRFNNLPTLLSTDWNYGAIAPGGSLTSGISNTITLPVCPKGLIGTNLHQNVYLSGGTGTAEYSTITGGTCAGDGINGGTIIFTPANNHSGAWTVTSGTGGLREAESIIITSAAGGGKILIPSGTFNVCNLYMDQANLTIEGVGGVEGPNLACSSRTLPVVFVNAQNCSIRHLAVQHGTLSVSPQVGGYGIQVEASGNGDFVNIDDVIAIYNYQGMFLGAQSWGIITNCRVQNNTAGGVWFDTSVTLGTYDIDNIILEFNGNDAIHAFVANGNNFNTGSRLRRIATFNNNGRGVSFDCQAGNSQVFATHLQEMQLGSDNGSEIYWNCQGSENYITDISIEGAGTAGTSSGGFPFTTWTATHVGYGIEIPYAGPSGSNINNPMVISNVLSTVNSYSGIYIGNAGVQLVGFSSTYNGMAGVPPPAGGGLTLADYQQAGVVVNANNVRVTGGYMALVGGNELYGIVVAAQSVSGVSQVQLGGNTYAPDLTQNIKIDQAVPYGPSIAAFQYTHFGSTCTTAASAGALCSSTFNFSAGTPVVPSFPDTNYQAVCGIAGTITNVPSSPLVTTKNTSSIVLQISAGTAAAASASGVDCFLFHQ